MSLNNVIRPVEINDIPRLLTIYSPYVLHTSFTPVFEAPSPASFEQQIREITAFYPFLVSLQANEIMGYAYAHPYRNAAGHQWSAETSVYMAPEGHGKGLAQKLYRALLAVLTLQGFVNAFAGIVLPNERSLAFHEKLQFTPVGIFKKGIYKAGNWHDVQWMQLSLNEHMISPPSPQAWRETMTLHREKIEKILNP